MGGRGLSHPLLSGGGDNSRRQCHHQEQRPSHIHDDHPFMVLHGLSARCERSRYYLKNGNSAAQKSCFIALGIGNRLWLKRSSLFSAQMNSFHSPSCLRQRVIMCMGSLKASSSSTLTKTSRNFPSAVSLKRSVTRSFSLCGVRYMSRKLIFVDKPMLSTTSSPLS